MSKETYSHKISESMYKKIIAMEHINFQNLFEHDDNFELALCVAYMTLSKEKIIKKEIKNQDRLARLSQKVDTTEIDKVFNKSFNKEMPIILYSRENNNIWILDNIRDSIMHGAFEIDEENKYFIINNNQSNRELVAKIPFSWFIAYAKNDIYSQKIANKYSIKAYYYNKNKKNQKNLITIKELFNNILYRVNVYGNHFNIKMIENRVIELFNIYALDEISKETIEKNKHYNSNNKYDQEYLISFHIASEKVKEIIEKEFPGVNITIYLDDRKHHFISKASKKLPKYYTNYDYMINMFNNATIQKGDSLLRYISQIIENIDTFKLENIEQNDWKINAKILHKLLNNQEITNDSNISMILKQDLKTLAAIYLNVYGLSTLVINHETLYNDYFLNEHPNNLGIKACIKQTYIDYASKRKNLIMQQLDTQIRLYEKQEQLNKCKNNDAKIKIQKNIDELNTKINQNNIDLSRLEFTTKFKRVTKNNPNNIQKMEKMQDIINQYFNHFTEAKTKEDKIKIRKVIGKMLDSQIEEEKNYTYGYCNNMKEALTIIRNCFSHIGRISIKKSNDGPAIIILNDFDTNGEKSGEIICKYDDLINLLKSPYQTSKQNKNHK